MSVRPELYLINGLARKDAVARMMQFQDEHPGVQVTSPDAGPYSPYKALIPPGAIPGEGREITVTALDLTGLMDQLEDLFAPASP